MTDEKLAMILIQKADKAAAAAAQYRATAELLLQSVRDDADPTHSETQPVQRSNKRGSKKTNLGMRKKMRRFMEDSHGRKVSAPGILEWLESEGFHYESRTNALSSIYKTAKAWIEEGLMLRHEDDLGQVAYSWVGKNK